MLLLAFSYYCNKTEVRCTVVKRGRASAYVFGPLNFFCYASRHFEKEGTKAENFARITGAQSKRGCRSSQHDKQEFGKICPRNTELLLLLGNTVLFCFVSFVRLRTSPKREPVVISKQSPINPTSCSLRILHKLVVITTSIVLLNQKQRGTNDKTMDTTFHRATAVADVDDDDDNSWEPQKKPGSSHDDETSWFEESMSDLAFDNHSFAEADDDDIRDDLTASETDSSDEESHSGEEDSLVSDDNESCCSLYDDEQDLACLQAHLQQQHHLAPGEKRVRFSTVEIREYASILGDHPCVQDSCPITLDWRFARARKRDIDTYENSRFFLRRRYPQKMNASDRRRRIRETSRISRRSLRELELQVAMHRLEDSMNGMSNFWGEFDRQEASRDPESFWSADSAVNAIEMEKAS